MTAAHLLNFHAPPAHNERVKVLIKKFKIKVAKASGERREILSKEKHFAPLCFIDEARASDLLLQIQDLERTLSQLDLLLLPLEN